MGSTIYWAILKIRAKQIRLAEDRLHDYDSKNARAVT